MKALFTNVVTTAAMKSSPMPGVPWGEKPFEEGSPQGKPIALSDHMRTTRAPATQDRARINTMAETSKRRVFMASSLRRMVSQIVRNR